MSIIKEHKRVNAILNNYRSQLDVIPDDRFNETPPKGGWSYAEVYSHIMQATLASSIALERCTHGTTKPTKEKLNFWGWFVMLSGVFPPGKLKVPTKVEAKMPTLSISKEEAKNLIIKCRRRMDEMAALITTTPTTRRSKHPRLGVLNAAQWYKFIRIHLQHHLKQLKRINAGFAG